MTTNIVVFKDSTAILTSLVGSISARTICERLLRRGRLECFDEVDMRLPTRTEDPRLQAGMAAIDIIFGSYGVDIKVLVLKCEKLSEFLVDL